MESDKVNRGFQLVVKKANFKISKSVTSNRLMKKVKSMKTLKKIEIYG